MNRIRKLFNFPKVIAREEQLHHWCAETWPELYRYVYSRVQNREEAEDITQEAYARILAKKPFPDLPSPGYLKMAALNIIRDRWRQGKSRGTQVQLEEALLSSENDVSKKLDGAIVEELMKGLSEEHRTVVRLRIIEGYSRTETAEKMNRSEDAVRGLQYRAVQNLRNLLLQHFEEGDEG